MTPAIGTLTGACVASAAVHAALAPAHLAEGSPLGVAFVTAAAATKTVELVGIAAGLFALRARTALRPQPRVAVGGPERRP